MLKLSFLGKHSVAQSPAPSPRDFVHQLSMCTYEQPGYEQYLVW